MDIIDIRPILSSHKNSLKQNSTTIVQFIIFLLIPAVISGALIYKNILLDSGALSALISTFAIFVGFTVNVMILLITNLGKQETYISENLVKDLRYNTAFELLLGTIILAASLFGNFIIDSIGSLGTKILSITIYFLVTNYLLTLMIITRRLYVIVDQELHE